MSAKGKHADRGTTAQGLEKQLRAESHFPRARAPESRVVGDSSAATAGRRDSRTGLVVQQPQEGRSSETPAPATSHGFVNDKPHLSRQDMPSVVSPLAPLLGVPVSKRVSAEASGFLQHDSSE